MSMPCGPCKSACFIDSADKNQAATFVGIAAPFLSTAATLPCGVRPDLCGAFVEETCKLARVFVQLPAVFILGLYHLYTHWCLLILDIIFSGSVGLSVAGFYRSYRILPARCFSTLELVLSVASTTATYAACWMASFLYCCCCCVLPVSVDVDGQHCAPQLL